MDPSGTEAPRFARLPWELRYALRRLGRRPTFSLAVILTLALAVGANTAIVSLFHGVLLAPLPYPEAERLAGFWMVSPAFGDGSRIQQSAATFLHFDGENRTFDSVGLAYPQTVTLDDGDRPERISAALVTASLYQVLETSAALGRTLHRDDSAPDAEPVVVLSHGLWASRFGRDPEVVGRILDIDGRSSRVVGVLPPNLRFPAEDTELWLPLRIDPGSLAPLRFRYPAYGRLKAGVSPDRAVRDLNRLIHTLPDAYPESFSREVIEQAEIRARVRALHEELVGGMRPTLVILLVAVLAVLGIAVANLANLFAVRVERRRLDLAVMSALGAGRGELLSGLLAEALWLGLAGTAAGLTLGAMAFEVLKKLFAEEVPRLERMSLEPGVLALTAGISLFVGLLAGTFPVLRVRWRSPPLHPRSGTSGSGAGSHRFRLFDTLVVVQVALALMLVVSSGLVVKSYWTLRGVDPGFAPRGVLTFRLALSDTEYGEWWRVVGFLHRFVDQVRGLAGVENSALASSLPLEGKSSILPYDVEGEVRSSEVRPTSVTKLVSEDYFATMGITVLTGRPLHRADATEARGAVVVNQAFADRHWRETGAVGRRIRLGSSETPLEVVGVVEGVRDSTLVDPPGPILYLPLAGPEPYSFARREISVAVKSDRPEGLVVGVRQVLSLMDRTVPIYDVRRLEEVVADDSARSRFGGSLLVAASVGALILGAVGLYGLLAYGVSRRQREIGIRMALGAQREGVRWGVVGRALALAAMGVALGLIGALSLRRVLASLLYEVQPSDPLILITSGVLLFLVAWLASAIPARRAARLDPALALREEP